MTSALIRSRCLVPVDVLGGLWPASLTSVCSHPYIALPGSREGYEVLEQRWQWGLGDVNLDGRC